MLFHSVVVGWDFYHTFQDVEHVTLVDPLQESGWGRLHLFIVHFHEGPTCPNYHIWCIEFAVKMPETSFEVHTLNLVKVAIFDIGDTDANPVPCTTFVYQVFLGSHSSCRLSG